MGSDKQAYELLVESFMLEHSDDATSSFEHRATASTSGGSTRDNTMISYRKDELRKALKNGVPRTYADSRQIKNALAAANGVLANTSIPAIDNAISKFDIAINAYGPASTVGRDLNGIRNVLYAIKRLLS